MKSEDFRFITGMFSFRLGELTNLQKVRNWGKPLSLTVMGWLWEFGIETAVKTKEVANAILFRDTFSY